MGKFRNDIYRALRPELDDFVRLGIVWDWAEFNDRNLNWWGHEANKGLKVSFNEQAILFQSLIFQAKART